jgi:hypothetical protein
MDQITTKSEDSRQERPLIIPTTKIYSITIKL